MLSFLEMEDQQRQWEEGWRGQPMLLGGVGLTRLSCAQGHHILHVVHGMLDTSIGRRRSTKSSQHPEQDGQAQIHL